MYIQDILRILRVNWTTHPDYAINSKAFTGIKELQDDIQSCCPFHSESRPSFGISRNYPYVYSCFTCKEKGTLTGLVAHVNQSTREKASALVERVYVKTLVDDPIKLNFTKDTTFESEEELEFYRSSDHDYFARRGLSKKSVEIYELGIDTYTKEAIYPVRDMEGNLRMLNRRSIEGKTFNNSKVSNKDILYGAYQLHTYLGTVKDIYITESVIDTISCTQVGFPAVALLGLHMHKTQVPILSALGVKTVNIFTDNDTHGRKVVSTIAKLLSTYPFRINYVDYGEGEEKDPNDLLKTGNIVRVLNNLHPVL